MNASSGDASGVSFEDVMEYFIICTDESCLMATPGGPIKIIGDKGKKKHEKIAGDSRVSITILP